MKVITMTDRQFEVLNELLDAAVDDFFEACQDPGNGYTVEDVEAFDEKTRGIWDALDTARTETR